MFRSKNGGTFPEEKIYCNRTLLANRAQSDAVKSKWGPATEENFPARASYEKPKNIRRDCRPLRLFRFLFFALLLLIVIFNSLLSTWY